MEPNTLIYGFNEFKVTYPKILQNYIHFCSFSIIKFQGLVARQPYLSKNIPYLVCYLDIAIWLLGTFVNSSCDIKINIKIVQNYG